jgi:hypothetical protein
MKSFPHFALLHVVQNSIYLLIVHQGHYRFDGDGGHSVHDDNRQVEEYCAPLVYVGRSHWSPTFSTSLFCCTSAAMGYGRCSCYHPLVHTDCWSGMSFWLLSDIRSSINTDLGVACYIQYSYPRHLSPHRHWSLSRPSESVQYRNVARFLAITLRRLGKLLAACNAIWIVLACLLQFGNFYNWCYCNSCTMERRLRCHIDECQ